MNDIGRGETRRFEDCPAIRIVPGFGRAADLL